MTHEYPPPTCIDDLEACQDCPFILEDNSRCPNLSALIGDQEVINNQTALIGHFKRAIVRRDHRIELLRNDRLLQIYSPQGLTDKILNEPELLAELGESNWGILYLDVRFLKYFNDQEGREAGDEYLLTVRDTVVDLTKHAFRSQPPASGPKDDRRHKGSPDEDILWRVGGDEISLLVRDVSASQLEIMHGRLSEPLSVENGMALGSSGQIPVVASVAWCHAKIVLDTTKTMANAPRNPLAVLDKLLQVTDAAHNQQKHQQYDEMWQRVLESYRPILRPFLRRPKDDRLVASRFISRFYDTSAATAASDG